MPLRIRLIYALERLFRRLRIRAEARQARRRKHVKAFTYEELGNGVSFDFDTFEELAAYLEARGKEPEAIEQWRELFERRF